MKCDELKDRWFWAYPTESVDCDGITGSAHEVYSKSEVDVAIDELKAELESLKATNYTESVDAGMENRRLKRALWLARSYRGRDNSILLPSKFMRNVWDNVERKCLKKAEEYI